MRPQMLPWLFAVVLVLLTASVGKSVIPTRKYDIHTTIEKVTPATDAQKKDGILVTIELKDRAKAVVVTKETNIHLQKGKLVPEGKASDLKKGQKVSVWLMEKSDKAQAVLIFP